MKIICIGRNYAEHVKELHNTAGGPDGLPTEPVFFLKPDTALLRNNDPFYIPSFSQEVHYECELVVRINRVGKCIEERFAHRYYDEVGLGIDFTARDLQREAIARGLPWERAKGFDHSAALSPEFIPLAELGGDVQRLHFTLDVNGERRQRGDTAEMLFTVDRIIATVSRYMTLRMGDLLHLDDAVKKRLVTMVDSKNLVMEGSYNAAPISVDEMWAWLEKYAAIFKDYICDVGQYLADADAAGKKVLFETLLLVERPARDLVFPHDEKNADQMNYLSGRSIDWVNKMAAQGTLEAHVNTGHVPNLILTMEDMSAESFGYMCYFFFRAVAMSVLLLGVNPFNQPGVEVYKKNMFRLLGKN